jgi:hypothetical protein
LEKDQHLNSPGVKKYFPARSYLGFLTFFLFVFLQSCYEDREGCLDLDATNFDVTADFECADCCTYPSLSISFSHKIHPSDTSSTTFFLNSVYLVPPDSVSLLKIKKVFFYLSDIQLIAADGSLVNVEDSIEVGYSLTPGDTLFKEVTDNYVYATRPVLAARTVGNIGAMGSFQGIQFRVGLKDESRDYLPNTVPSGHPLAFQSDSLNWNEADKYAYQYWEFYRDTMDVDSTVIRITAPNSNFIQLYEPFELKRGFDVAIILRIDYLKWWEGIDPKNQDLESIKNALVANLPEAFSISSIESN